MGAGLGLSKPKRNGLKIIIAWEGNIFGAFINGKSHTYSVEVVACVIYDNFFEVGIFEAVGNIFQSIIEGIAISENFSYICVGERIADVEAACSGSRVLTYKGSFIYGSRVRMDSYLCG